MNEKVQSIEEAAIAAVLGHIRANVEDMQSRMAAKDAGKGAFTITTVEDLIIDLVDKTKREYTEMYSRLLSEKDREHGGKKRPSGDEERGKTGKDADYSSGTDHAEADGAQKGRETKDR